MPALPADVALSGDLMISDSGRPSITIVGPDGSVLWRFPPPGSSAALFGPWDDAFFDVSGTRIVANSERTHTVIAIDRRLGTVLWSAGHPGLAGNGARFHTPDDAVPTPDGTVWVADIGNCRLVHLTAEGKILGTRGDGLCRHRPPTSFAAPNGAFPTPDGGLVVTEIGGSWVDRLSADGTLLWSVHAPVRYPSDAVLYPDGSVLLTDYANPGAVVRLAPDGRVLWRYAPRGPAALDHPSIALPLAANRVAICDDWHGRVVIVDPTNDAVVWTYSGAPGERLRTPDGLSFWPAAANGPEAAALPRRSAAQSPASGRRPTPR